MAMVAECSVQEPSLAGAAAEQVPGGGLSLGIDSVPATRGEAPSTAGTTAGDSMRVL